MKDELRAMTKNQRSFDSAVMMSSLMPSEKYSCSGSPLRLVNGSTAMAGRSGSGNARGRGAARIRTGRGFLAVGLLDGSDEAHALAGDGADQPLLLAGVVERAAGRIDAAREGQFRHDAAVPDRVEQIVACVTTRSRLRTR